MSRRIEVELTSSREDGTWTWRAAGAKLPKGDLQGSLLYDGAKVGDVVRADADFMMDGIVIIGVLAPKGARKELERIEVVGTPRKDDDQLVTTTLAPKGPRKERRDGDRRPPRDGDRAGRPAGDRKPRPAGAGTGSQDERRKREDRSEHPNRPARATRPAPEPKPKPKRLRAGRTHRNAVLATLPEEQKPVAEQVLRGGIPAVRLAVEKQNESNKAEGKPEISAAPLMALAEQIMPALRTADWRDKAEAALADVAELDLRDLRSVVVASDVAARDEETRDLAEKLRVALAARVESEQVAWLAEITETLDGGRTVRALRVSSRPPKAGSPLPAELAVRLTEATAAALTADTGSDRYATVLDALAYSPVRTQVKPLGIPAEPTPELMAAVKKAASRLPAIAALFGIEATAAPKAGKPRPKVKPPRPELPATPPVPASAAESDAPVAAESDESVVEAPGVESPAPEAQVVDAAPEAIAAVEAEAIIETEAVAETVVSEATPEDAAETASEAEQTE
jgi:hypothetical protein